MEFLSIDVGKSLVSAGVVSNSKVFNRKTEKSKFWDGDEAIVRQIVQIGKSVLNDVSSKPTAVGIGLPAIVDSLSGKVVTSGFMPEWRGFHAKKHFENAFKLPTAVTNDIRAAALGEAVYGAGKGRNIVSYGSLSTGFGVAIVVKGKIFQGANQLAGQVGFIRYGERDFNKYISGSGFVSSATRRIGRPATPEEVFDLAKKKHPEAMAMVEESEQALAHVIAMIQTTVDPDIIVLGGSIALQQPQFIANAKEKSVGFLGRPHREILGEVGPRVEIADLGTNAGLVGAGELARVHQVSK